MYQSPIVAYGFNHQSLHRQPVSNLRRINEIVWNQNNEIQRMGGVMPHSFSSVPNQQSISDYANLEKQRYLSSNDSNNVQIHSQKAVTNNHENSLVKNRLQVTKTYNPPKQGKYFVFFCFIHIKFFF
jgi:hypothetical protein